MIKDFLIYVLTVAFIIACFAGYYKFMDKYHPDYYKLKQNVVDLSDYED